MRPNNHLRSINIEEFSCLDAESINLSSNAFKTFPKELSKFSNLKTIDLSNNPIKSLGGKNNFYLRFESGRLRTSYLVVSVPLISSSNCLKKPARKNNLNHSEFALNGAEDAYRYLEEIKFENCGEFDYVGDAAFSFLKSLESVSFSGSELFYLSGQAFYDCQKLKNLDLSNTNVKYIDSCLPIYLGTVSIAIICRSHGRQVYRFFDPHRSAIIFFLGRRWVLVGYLDPWCRAFW